MSDATSNSTTIQADAFYVWDAASKTHVNLQTPITGLAPETLNTLNELASAVGNDPNFASNLARRFRIKSTQRQTPSP